jgi:hypothetical protein
MAVSDVNQLEALPSLSTKEIGSLGGALHDHRCDSSRGTSTSQGSARILDEDSSSPRPRPLRREYSGQLKPKLKTRTAPGRWPDPP